MKLSPQESSVGVVGLGNLGAPITRALLSAGWATTVYDTSRGKVDALVGDGAQAASGIEDLAECDALVLLVPDDDAVRSVLSGPGGWWSSRRGDGGAVVVHSTLLPDSATRLAETAHEHGCAFVDAPVSGGAERAAQGELTVMVGASDDDLELCRPLLSSVGSDVLHVGPAGAGAATKLANQLMMLSALAGAQEAMVLAAAHGVDEQAVLSAVASSTGDSWVTKNWGFFDRTATAYDEGGTAPRDRPWSKDLHEVLLAARAADVRVPVAALLAQTLADRVEEHARDHRERNGR